MLDFSNSAEQIQPRPGHELIRQLRAGKLPQMVDWFDPVLLAQIGARTVVSATMGQYADQRLMQAATDGVDERTLQTRYDYSGDAEQGEYWIDYISDLGDGFEATYAMAYLMAAPRLQVGGNDLQAGRLLIMGGDQAYPQSSAQEYQDRLRTPYDAAFTDSAPPPKSTVAQAIGIAPPPGKLPERKLFALPGNHDWYDGLGAFDNLFCSARNRMAKGNGNLIGGWRCKQHRSYFAIKLPHEWWLWGADIQLGGVFDKPQRDYFDLMSQCAGGSGKIILCLAEPSWTHENCENLTDITNIAQKYGAKVCAVIAGDLHHYTRYVANNENLPAGTPLLDTQFITCGGGGAFAHATHNLKCAPELEWPKAPQQPTYGFLESHSKPAERPVREGKPETTRYSLQLQPEALYPSAMKSRLLCLKNLFLPFHNARFAVAVGFIYLIYAWAYSLAVIPREISRRLAELSQIEAASASATSSVVKDWQSRQRNKKTNDLQSTALASSSAQSIDGMASALRFRHDLLFPSSKGETQTRIGGLAELVRTKTQRLSQQINGVTMLFVDLQEIAPGIVPPELVLEGGLRGNFVESAQRYNKTISGYETEKSDWRAQVLRSEYGSVAEAAGKIADHAEAAAKDKNTSQAASTAARLLGAKARSLQAEAKRRTADIVAINASDVAQDIWTKSTDPFRVLLAAQINPLFLGLLLALWALLVYYVDASAALLGYVTKFVIGTAHFLLHVIALLVVSALVGPEVTAVGSPTVLPTSMIIAVSLSAICGLALLIVRGSRAAIAFTPLAVILSILLTRTENGQSFVQLLSLLVQSGNSAQVMTFFDQGVQAIVGSRIWHSPFFLNVWANLMFSFATVMLGGLIGAAIFGLYWTLMSFVFGKHRDDAFGALGIRHYKHFLRMKVQSDRVTVYPIAIEKVPGRRGWMSAWEAAERGRIIPEHDPRILPKEDLKPFLIERPYDIRAPFKMT